MPRAGIYTKASSVAVVAKDISQLSDVTSLSPEAHKPGDELLITSGVNAGRVAKMIAGATDASLESSWVINSTQSRAYATEADRIARTGFTPNDEETILVGNNQYLVKDPANSALDEPLSAVVTSEVPYYNSGNTTPAPFDFRNINNPPRAIIEANAELTNAPMNIATGLRGSFLKYSNGNAINIMLMVNSAPEPVGSSIWVTATNDGTNWTAWRRTDGRYRGSIATIAELKAINPSIVETGVMYFLEETNRPVTYNRTATAGSYRPDTNPATGYWVETGRQLQQQGWANISNPLVAGELFVQSGVTGGANNLVASEFYQFQVPDSLAGQSKGATWNATEADRYNFVGRKESDSVAYINNIRIVYRNKTSSSGGVFNTINIKDVQGNTYPAGSWRISGCTDSQFIGVDPINYNNPPAAGTSKFVVLEYIGQSSANGISSVTANYRGGFESTVLSSVSVTTSVETKHFYPSGITFTTNTEYVLPSAVEFISNARALAVYSQHDAGVAAVQELNNQFAAQAHLEGGAGYSLNASQYIDGFYATITNTDIAPNPVSFNGFAGAFLRDGGAGTPLVSPITVPPNTQYRVEVVENGGVKFLNFSVGSAAATPDTPDHFTAGLELQFNDLHNSGLNYGTFDGTAELHDSPLTVGGPFTGRTGLFSCGFDAVGNGFVLATVTAPSGMAGRFIRYREAGAWGGWASIASELDWVTTTGSGQTFTPGQFVRISDGHAIRPTYSNVFSRPIYLQPLSDWANVPALDPVGGIPADPLPTSGTNAVTLWVERDAGGTPIAWRVRNVAPDVVATGSTLFVPGTRGNVPAPPAGIPERVLRADMTWARVPSNGAVIGLYTPNTALPVGTGVTNGDYYLTATDGTVGQPFPGVTLRTGDEIVALEDNPAIAAQWFIRPRATNYSTGTAAQVTTGTDAIERVWTPAELSAAIDANALPIFDATKPNGHYGTSAIAYISHLGLVYQALVPSVPTGTNPITDAVNWGKVIPDATPPIKTWAQNTLYRVGDLLSIPMHNVALPSKIYMEVVTQFTSGATPRATLPELGNMRYMGQNLIDNNRIINVSYPAGFQTIDASKLYQLKANQAMAAGTTNIVSDTAIWDVLSDNYLRLVTMSTATAGSTIVSNRSLSTITYSGGSNTYSLLNVLPSDYYAEVNNVSTVSHTINLGEATHTLNGVTNGTFSISPNQRCWIRRTSTTSWEIKPFDSSVIKNFARYTFGDAGDTGFTWSLSRASGTAPSVSSNGTITFPAGTGVWQINYQSVKQTPAAGSSSAEIWHFINGLHHATTVTYSSDNHQNNRGGFSFTVDATATDQTYRCRRGTSTGNGNTDAVLTVEGYTARESAVAPASGFTLTSTGSTASVTPAQAHSWPTVHKIALNSGRRLASITINNGSADIINRELGLVRVWGVTAAATLTVAEEVGGFQRLTPPVGQPFWVSSGAASQISGTFVASHTGLWDIVLSVVAWDDSTSNQIAVLIELLQGTTVLDSMQSGGLSGTKVNNAWIDVGNGALRGNLTAGTTYTLRATSNGAGALNGIAIRNAILRQVA